MTKKLYLVLLFVSVFIVKSFSQINCNLPVTALYDTSIPCSQTCVPLSVPFPDIKNTTTYKLIKDQYLPYPFQCPSDVELTDLYIDDWYSEAIDMPFNFCFYGSSYNRIVIGSNGMVTFDVSNADCGNSYIIPTNTPLPRTGGTQCNAGSQYYPRACIMGAFYDIDPNAPNADTVGRRISYYFTGTAPYRKMVIVYYNVPVFGGACNRMLAKQEIVLYESTGVIDVHIENKPLCISSTSDGRAIIGIQDWSRTQAVVDSARNGTQWTASNETYRFVPSGTGAPLFRSVNLYQGNTLLGTGTVTSNGNGQLIASFANNICLNTDTAVFRAVAVYASCSNPNDSINYETKIIVRHNSVLDVVADLTPPSCATGGSGTITITEPVGAQYEYSIDYGATFQASPSFTMPGGVYAVYARNALVGCSGATVVNIPIIQNIAYNTAVTPVICYGTTTGQAIVTTQGGSGPFQYSADSGVTYQMSNTLLLNAGRHIIRVKDVNGCIKDTAINITQPDSISIATPQVNAAYCSGQPDGQIIINAAGGVAPYTYSLVNNSNNYQNSNTLFANVGSFTAYVKDHNNCIDSTVSITVPLNDTMRLANITDTTLCLGSSLTIVPNTNATQFKWSPNIAISDTSSALPIVAPQDTLTYYLSAKLGQLCTRTDTFTVNVLKRPIVNAGPDTTICFGTKAYFHAEAVRGKTFRWSPTINLNNYTVANPVATGFTPISYTLEVTDPYGCGFKEYDTINLMVRPKVRAFAGQDTTATLGQGVQLTGCCMDIYQWQPASIFESDTARNPIGHFPAGTTQVVMITTTPEGCQGQDTVIVKGYIGPTYYVPSAFSPNSDGRNDIFRPVPVGITETYYFNVYNRYGQMVYTTKTFMEGWDGKWKGQMQPDAAYVWMVKGKGIDGKIVEMKGTVILMK